MFKPQKHSSEVSQQRGGRNRLPSISKAPDLGQLRMLLTEAERVRGSLCELPITRSVPPNFVLTCQYDSGADPVWTLYEGDDGSKVVWGYPTNNLEMIFDIIAMSVQEAAGGPVKLPPKPDAAPQQRPPYPPQQGQPPYPPQQPYQGQPPYPGQQPYPQQPYPPQQYPPHPQQYPPQQWPPQQQGWGQPGQPGWAQPQPGSPYPPQPGQPPYPAPGQQPYPYQQQQPQQGQPAGAGTAGEGAYSGFTPAPDLVAKDMGSLINLIDQSPNLLLGHLFIEAGVLPEPCVEAALKLQELVRQGHLNNLEAIDALKKAALNGGHLDPDLLALCGPSRKITNSNDPRDVARRVISLIQDAGIITEQDYKTAAAVRAKHGGDVGSILIAAGKMEKATLDASKACQPLLIEGKITQEQAVKALRHCQKTKGSLQEALKELSISLL